MKRGEQGFVRILSLILTIVVLLVIFKVDVRGYAERAWEDYIHPFITGETFSGLRDKIRARNNIEP